MESAKFVHVGLRLSGGGLPKTWSGETVSTIKLLVEALPVRGDKIGLGHDQGAIVAYPVHDRIFGTVDDITLILGPVERLTADF